MNTDTRKVHDVIIIKCIPGQPDRFYTWGGREITEDGYLIEEAEEARGE